MTMTKTLPRPQPRAVARRLPVMRSAELSSLRPSGGKQPEIVRPGRAARGGDDSGVRSGTVVPGERANAVLARAGRISHFASRHMGVRMYDRGRMRAGGKVSLLADAGAAARP